jgi:hypothetical protein
MDSAENAPCSARAIASLRAVSRRLVPSQHLAASISILHMLHS